MRSYANVHSDDLLKLKHWRVKLINTVVVMWWV